MIYNGETYDLQAMSLLDLDQLHSRINDDGCSLLDIMAEGRGVLARQQLALDENTLLIEQVTLEEERRRLPAPASLENFPTFPRVPTPDEHNGLATSESEQAAFFPTNNNLIQETFHANSGGLVTKLAAHLQGQGLQIDDLNTAKSNRFSSAIELISTGGWKLADRHFLIESRTEPETYHKVYSSQAGHGGDSCDCPDYHYHAGRKGLPCAHQLAALLLAFTCELFAAQVQEAERPAPFVILPEGIEVVEVPSGRVLHVIHGPIYLDHGVRPMTKIAGKDYSMHLERD